MSVPILYPRFDHPAVEERYASWQTQMLLRRDGGRMIYYDPDEPVSYAVADVEADVVLVITDPLVLPPANLGHRLRQALSASDAVAALPVSNESANAHQRRAPLAPYVTLRELETVTAEMQRHRTPGVRVTWDGSDPAAYLCRRALLDKIDDPARRALASREVVISESDYVHRWSSFRGQVRHDLLGRIGPGAKNILEFGCGEAPLGEALKKRQPCRVVGIEIDPKAAAIARKRIDDVYCGDVREIVSLVHDRFDWIIGGDIVEHLDEPWSFLADLRRIAAPGGHLLLSIPNVANASIIADLLQGRFDYVYMGLTCVGHLRFFTRRSIEELLRIAGWSVAEIVPQEIFPTPVRDDLIARLEAAGIGFSRDDLVAPGYYVLARNDG